MKKIFYVFNFCFLFYGMSYQAQSQTPLAKERFTLNTDYNRFWQNDSLSYLEISTAFFLQSISLNHDSSGFHGKVNLNVVIQEKSSEKPVHIDRLDVPINIIDSVALAKAKSFIIHRTYVVGTGSYNVSILGYDSFLQVQRDSSSFIIDVARRPDTLALSDIEVCSNIIASSDHQDPFYKNSYRVVPNPSCVFGTTSSPVVFTYMELYNVNIGMTYKIKVQVVDLKGTIQKSRTSLRRYTVRHAVEVTSFNVVSIHSGRYAYEVIVCDTLDRELARSKRPIYIHNPKIQSLSETTPSVRSVEFAGMISDELAEEFRVAKYVTLPGDNKIFDKLTTVEARQEFLQNFWTRVEKENLGSLYLTRSVYLQRVLKANQRYKIRRI